MKRTQVKEILEALGIRDVNLMNTIMRDSKLIDGVFKFNYDLKIGRIKSDKNPAGLLLTILGLKQAKITAKTVWKNSFYKSNVNIVNMVYYVYIINHVYF